MSSLQRCRVCLDAIPQTLGRHAARHQPRPTYALQRVVESTRGPARTLHTTRACQSSSDGASFLQRFIRSIPGINRQTYQIYGSATNLYKFLSKQAPYTIDPKLRKKDAVKTAEDGEEIGTGNSVWHTELGLPPTFSTWSQVTMMHMYLAVVRYRCFSKEHLDAYQKSLVDAFFYEAEERMDVCHGISSRALRQRHLKDLFVAWRGLMLAYDEGLVRGDAALASAVWRNLFKARPDVDVRRLAAVVGYMRASLLNLDRLSDEDVQFRMHSAFQPNFKDELMYVDAPARELADVVGKKLAAADEAVVATTAAPGEEKTQQQTTAAADKPANKLVDARFKAS